MSTENPTGRTGDAHVGDELPRLLTGEAEHATVLAAAAHLRDCVDCRQELVSAVVAHASLTSARRFAPEVVAAPVEAAAGPLNGAAPVDRPTARATALPDLTAVFERARREAQGSRSGPRRRVVAAVAAAAVIAAGATVASLALSSRRTPPGRTVALAAYDSGTTGATARLSPDGELSIDASSLPDLAGKRYEVWLTDANRTAMQPVGWIGSDGTGDMRVPDELMRQFTDIEVSVQSMHASTYDYSGTSVLRGAYRG